MGAFRFESTRSIPMTIIGQPPVRKPQLRSHPNFKKETLGFLAQNNTSISRYRENSFSFSLEQPNSAPTRFIRGNTFWRFMRHPLAKGVGALLLLAGISALVVGTCGIGATVIGATAGLALTIGGGVSTGVGAVSLGVSFFPRPRRPRIRPYLDLEQACDDQHERAHPPCIL